MQDFQNNVSKCLTRKYTNTQVHKYTIQHKCTIRHNYNLGQIVAKSYALHVKLHLASKPNFLKTFCNVTFCDDLNQVVFVSYGVFVLYGVFVYLCICVFVYLCICVFSCQTLRNIVLKVLHHCLLKN